MKIKTLSRPFLLKIYIYIYPFLRVILACVINFIPLPTIFPFRGNENRELTHLQFRIRSKFEKSKLQEVERNKEIRDDLYTYIYPRG